jgi:hypothetical protein
MNYKIILTLLAYTAYVIAKNDDDEPYNWIEWVTDASNRVGAKALWAVSIVGLGRTAENTWDAVYTCTHSQDGGVYQSNSECRNYIRQAYQFAAFTIFSTWQAINMAGAQNKRDLIDASNPLYINLVQSELLRKIKGLLPSNSTVAIGDVRQINVRDSDVHELYIHTNDPIMKTARIIMTSETSMTCHVGLHNNVEARDTTCNEGNDCHKNPAYMWSGYYSMGVDVCKEHGFVDDTSKGLWMYKAAGMAAGTDTESASYFKLYNDDNDSYEWLASWRFYAFNDENYYWSKCDNGH